MQKIYRMSDEEIASRLSEPTVACGTGEHGRFPKAHFAVDGVDINEDYLRAARLKNPAGGYRLADMTEFNLGRTYDCPRSYTSAEAPATKLRWLRIHPGRVGS